MLIPLLPPLLAAIPALLPQASPQAPAPAPEWETLPSGIRLVLRPLDNAPVTAVMVLDASGEAQDPAARPGLAHLLEHLGATSAAGKFPASPVEKIVADYPDGWNGQTSWDHVLLAWMVPSEKWVGELEHLAARIQDLHPTQEDLDRELGRMEEELGNMYGRWPDLAAGNWVRTCLRAGPEGPRRGGEIEKLRDISLDEIARAWKEKTRPQNLILVLCGRFDPGQARARIVSLFPKAPPAAETPAEAASGKPLPKGGETFQIHPAGAPAPYSLAGFPTPGFSGRAEPMADAMAAGLALLQYSAIQDRRVKCQFNLFADPLLILFFTSSQGKQASGAALSSWLDRARKFAWRGMDAMQVRLILRHNRGLVPRDLSAQTLAASPQLVYSIGYSAGLRALRAKAGFWRRFDKRVESLDEKRLAEAVAKLLDDRQGVQVEILPSQPSGSR